MGFSDFVYPIVITVRRHRFSVVALTDGETLHRPVQCIYREDSVRSRDTVFRSELRNIFLRTTISLIWNLPGVPKYTVYVGNFDKKKKKGMYNK